MKKGFLKLLFTLVITVITINSTAVITNSANEKQPASEVEASTNLRLSSGGIGDF